VKKGVEKSGIETDGAGASRLDTETGLAPMPSLGVVPVVFLSVTVQYTIFHRCGRLGDVQSNCRQRGVVPDGVAGPQANPLGDGAVLLLRTRKLLLGAERLLGL
jgi:hypothetical protein